MNAQSWLAQLQSNGYRLTNARKAVVETVANSAFALNPLEVFERSKSTCPGLGLVSVYRTLEKLEELGLIQVNIQTFVFPTFLTICILR